MNNIADTPQTHAGRSPDGPVRVVIIEDLREVREGLTMLINGALANGILQSVVPDQLRGRVMAAYVFVYVGFTPIGSLIAGAMARVTSVQWAIGTGGAIMLLYAIWAFWKFPELRRV